MNEIYFSNDSYVNILSFQKLFSFIVVRCIYLTVSGISTLETRNLKIARGMFPFQFRLIPSARSPFEIKIWLLELVMISNHGISSASRCHIGSLFRIGACLVELAKVPCPMNHLQDGHRFAAAALSPGNPFACP